MHKYLGANVKNMYGQVGNGTRLRKYKALKFVSYPSTFF